MTRKENYLRTLFRQNPEWVPFSGEACKGVASPICEIPTSTGTDAFGCEWRLEDSCCGVVYPVHNNLVITDITRWREQLRLPDLDSADWDAIRQQADAINRDQYLVSGAIQMGLFERMYLLMGMEEALMAYYTNEEEMYELAGAIADYKIEYIQRYYEAAHLDILWYGDDWGTQNNLFISPEKWRKIIKPHTKRIYDCAKSLGIIIDQHSCGKIESIFEDLVEIGADCWNPCQPCNNLAELKRKYGDKICFRGGIDSQFVMGNPNSTTEDVVIEVKRRIDEMALPNGGYIASPSHSVNYTPEKMEAMHRTVREYGREIYQARK